MKEMMAYLYWSKSKDRIDAMIDQEIP